MKVIKKIGLLITYYVIFFLVFYGVLFIPRLSYMVQKDFTIDFSHALIYLFIIVPLISFFTIPKYLIKKHNFNKYFVWIFDVVIVYVAAIGFSLYSLSTFTWGGF